MPEPVLVDTDVLIDFARGVPATASLLAEVASSSDLGVCCVTEMELIVGCRNKAELTQLQSFLSGYRRVQLTASIGDQAVELMTQYRLSHGLLLPDALIAATAVVRGCLLLTRNRRHFDYIPGISLLEYRV